MKKLSIAIAVIGLFSSMYLIAIHTQATSAIIAAEEIRSTSDTREYQYAIARIVGANGAIVANIYLVAVLVGINIILSIIQSRRKSG